MTSIDSQSTGNVECFTEARNDITSITVHHSSVYFVFGFFIYCFVRAWWPYQPRVFQFVHYHAVRIPAKREVKVQICNKRLCTQMYNCTAELCIFTDMTLKSTSICSLTFRSLDDAIWTQFSSEHLCFLHCPDSSHHSAYKPAYLHIQGDIWRQFSPLYVSAMEQGNHLPSIRI